MDTNRITCRVLGASCILLALAGTAQAKGYAPAGI